jgi:hypothetical protein
VHKVGSELNDARVIGSACCCAGQLWRQYFANRYRLLTDRFIVLADLEKDFARRAAALQQLIPAYWSSGLSGSRSGNL